VAGAPAGALSLTRTPPPAAGDASPARTGCDGNAKTVKIQRFSVKKRSFSLKIRLFSRVFSPLGQRNSRLQRPRRRRAAKAPALAKATEKQQVASWFETPRRSECFT
jgi:hypothetical protein